MVLSLPLVDGFDVSKRDQKSSSGGVAGGGDSDLFFESFIEDEAGVRPVGVVFLGVGSKLSHISSSQPDEPAVSFLVSSPKS